MPGDLSQVMERLMADVSLKFRLLAEACGVFHLWFRFICFADRMALSANQCINKAKVKIKRFTFNIFSDVTTTECSPRLPLYMFLEIKSVLTCVYVIPAIQGRPIKCAQKSAHIPASRLGVCDLSSPSSSHVQNIPVEYTNSDIYISAHNTGWRRGALVTA